MFHAPRNLLSLSLAIPLLAAISTGCGDDAMGDDDTIVPVECATPLSERYLPLTVGASWTFDVTDLRVPGSAPVQKATTVEAFEDVGDRKSGTEAFRIRTEKANGATVSWQQDLCTSIVRHREMSYDTAAIMESDQFYMHSKLRVDETPGHLVPGATWSIRYEEVEVDPVAGESRVTKDESWSVVAIDESVTVPAGTFSTVHLRKVTSGDADKHFWFAAGVGKIKEEGEQREELRTVELP
jgi:hypothetical protein